MALTIITAKVINMAMLALGRRKLNLWVAPSVNCSSDKEYSFDGCLVTHQNGLCPEAVAINL